MLAVVLSLAALAAPPPPVKPDLAACKPPAAANAQQRGRAERPRRLGELPPARHELAVLRTIDGCAVASVVSFDPATRNRVVTYAPVGRAQTQGAETRPRF